MPTSSDGSDQRITAELRFYAPFKDPVGKKSVSLELSPGATVADALAEVVEEHPALDGELLDDAGSLRDGVRALHNGRAAAEGDTLLEDGDEISLTTPIHGG